MLGLTRNQPLEDEMPAAPVPPVLRVAEAPVEIDEDAELCARVARGDDAAFELLVTRYQNRVFAFCLRILGSRSDAEDLAQEVFVTLYQNAGEFRGDARFATWLFRIARNQAINRAKYLDRRGRKTHRPIDEVSEGRMGAEPEGRPDELTGARQQAEIVRKAIGTLDADHRSVVLLRDVEDLSYEEIAEVTGLPLGTVKSRIHRGRSVLAERLARWFR